MGKTISTMDRHMENKGFVIKTDEHQTPFLVPASGGECGFESPRELLYIFAMDVLYKFQRENFEVRFDGTRNFIRTHYQKFNRQTKPWFKDDFRKLLDRDPEGFYHLFKLKLQKELSFYYGECAKPLVEKMQAELEKIDLEVE